MKVDQNGNLYLKPFDFELLQVKFYPKAKANESGYDYFQAGHEATAFFRQGKHLLRQGHDDQASEAFLQSMTALDRNYRALKTVLKWLKTLPENQQIGGGFHNGIMSYAFNTQIDNFHKDTHWIKISFTAKEGERHLSREDWITIFRFYIRSQSILMMSLYHQIRALDRIFLDYFEDDRPKPNAVWQED